MHRLNELATRLTPAQVKEVEDFAEFLIERRNGSSASEPKAPHKISYEGWAGCLANVDPEKSNKQFVREAWDELIDKMEGSSK